MENGKKEKIYITCPIGSAKSRIYAEKCTKRRFFNSSNTWKVRLEVASFLPSKSSMIKTSICEVHIIKVLFIDLKCDIKYVLMYCVLEDKSTILLYVTQTQVYLTVWHRKYLIAL